MNINKLDTPETNTRKFLFWFIGFSEGNGSWIVSNCYDKRINKWYLQTFFIINQKDPKVLFYIKKQLGFGTVKKLNSGYWRYCVTSLKGTKILINIFKNNLKLNKTNNIFKLFVQAYNSRVLIEESFDIESIKQNLELTLNNGWLAGFIDAVGCFSVNVKNRLIYLRFSISQIDSYNIIIQLKNLLNLGNIIKEDINLYKYYYSSINPKIYKLIDYLEKYPLKSNKNIDFVKWKKIRIRLIDGLLNERLKNRRSKMRLRRLIKNQKSKIKIW